jgi:hypothetical protein
MHEELGLSTGIPGRYKLDDARWRDEKLMPEGVNRVISVYRIRYSIPSIFTREPSVRSDFLLMARTVEENWLKMVRHSRKLRDDGLTLYLFSLQTQQRSTPTAYEARCSGGSLALQI